jgi:hypothetical protein
MMSDVYILAILPSGNVLAVALLSRGLGVAVIIIALLFALIIGGYARWRRRQARQRQRNLSAAIEAQASLAPKTLSDPNQRAALDKLRQRFQAGLQEFQSRGKDIFRLPWYLIIGEPGSGKTEAIRHSGVEFPPGLQNELQGSGGTVNMDWWFTNRGIVLDTAGRLVFNEAASGEAPEWIEFLRLLKKARYHCPINGLFIVLSVESLIRDSSEQIEQKARRLAQQLDLIQRTLDVRFPVYLLVTKTDLLAGFREFFSSLDDPLLCHQMFGWSNADPLDSKFQPDQVGEHLSTVAQRLRRRRLALLRESLSRRLEMTVKLSQAGASTHPPSSAPAPNDDVDALFALPESLLRLRPRLHLYLETVFTRGEWSPKPLFLRGIYFTSSMTEGKTLDEAIAFATGLPLDQLPEEEIRTVSRAYFLRDLFLEKVFRESGLVTRATNTIRLLRQRRFAVLGVTALSSLLFLGFASLAYGKLKKSVLDEMDYWKLGASSLARGVWSPPIVYRIDDTRDIYAYGGTNRVPASGEPTLVQYHARLEELAQRDLAGGWIFKPISWAIPGGVRARPLAQRVLFEDWVLDPVVQSVRSKLSHARPPGAEPSLTRLRESLVWLTDLEQEPLALNSAASRAVPEKTLQAFLSYLAEKDVRFDPELKKLLESVYAQPGAGQNSSHWPPDLLSGGRTLASNKALATGLRTFATAAVQVDKSVLQQMGLLNQWVDKLHAYSQAEQDWFSDNTDPCLSLRQHLLSAKFALDGAWAQFRGAAGVAPTNSPSPATLYSTLEAAASNSAPVSILASIKAGPGTLSEGNRLTGLVQEIQALLGPFPCVASGEVHNSYYQRQTWLAPLERDALERFSGKPAWEVRWNFYSEACLLGVTNAELSAEDIGHAWNSWALWTNKVNGFQSDLTRYFGPFKVAVDNACGRILRQAGSNTQQTLAVDYSHLVTSKLSAFSQPLREPTELASRRDWFGKVEHDLASAGILGGQARNLAPVLEAIPGAELGTLKDFTRCLRQQMRFPLLASASTDMDATAWSEARQLLNQTAAELDNPLWKSRPPLAEEAARLQAVLKKHQKLLDALTGKDDHIVEAEITTVPYERLSPVDKRVVSVFRYARAADGPPAAVEDLTRPRGPLFRKPMNQPAKLLLLADRNGAPLRQLEFGPWWLLHAIHDGKAAALEDGAVWQVKVPVTDEASKISGNLVLQVRLLSASRLPKPEEWVE